jgi:hypothetical protein
MILTLLTIMGISGIRTSNFELQSATNANLHKMAFFSAEASRAYVMNNNNLYGADNIDPATPHLYPNNSNPYAPVTGGTVPPFNLGNGNTSGLSRRHGDPVTMPTNSRPIHISRSLSEPDRGMRPRRLKWDFIESGFD